MSKQEVNILNKLGELGMKDTELLGGTVVKGSVDEAKMTCSVRILMLDADVPDVLLNVNTGNVKGIVPIPEDNSNVWVSWIEGQLCVLKAAKLKKLLIDMPQVLVTCPEVIFNDGKNGGIPISKKSASRLNLIEKDINTLKNLISGWVVAPNDGGAALKLALASWISQSLVQTKESDLANTKIKH